MDARVEIQRLKDLIALCLGEIGIFQMYVDESENAPEEVNFFWRRTGIRMIFAQVEGITYALKRVALSKGKGLGSGFTAAEWVLLEERGYSLGRGGKVVEDKLRLRTLPNLRFALDMFIKGFGLEMEIDYGVEGWAALDRAVKVRDRLTHPKSPGDLEVSDEELGDALAGEVWLIGCVKQVASARLALRE